MWPLIQAILYLGAGLALRGAAQELEKEKGT